LTDLLDEREGRAVGQEMLNGVLPERKGDRLRELPEEDSMMTPCSNPVNARERVSMSDLQIFVTMYWSFSHCTVVFTWF
jgi:hypothetical protein